MRVSDPSALFTTIPQLQKLQQLQQSQQERLVTGRKINHLEEAPSAVHGLLESRATREALIQYRDNSTRAMSVTEAGIKTLGYLKDLAEQAQKMIDDSSLRGPGAAKQVDQMLTDAIAAANADFAGEYLFGGQNSTAAPFSLNDEGGVDFAGAGESRSFKVAEGASLSPFTGEAANQGIHEFLTTLASLRDALNTGDAATLQQADQSLKQAEDNLLEASGELGLKQFRIEILQSRDAAKYAALDQEEARLTTADPTETIVGLLNTQKAYQGALQSMSMVNKLSLLNYV